MADDVSFNRKFECDYGVMVEVTPMIRRIVANNPGPYTFKGTGTYVIAPCQLQCLALYLQSVLCHRLQTCGGNTSQKMAK